MLKFDLSLFFRFKYFCFHNKPVWNTNLKNKNEGSWINEWSDLFQFSNIIFRKYMIMWIVYDLEW